MVRIKRRYILFSLRFLTAFTKGTCGPIMNSIREAVEQVYGDFGAACLQRSFSIKRFDQASGQGMISTRKGTHNIVMAVMPLITSINNKPAALDILHLSGTIRGCLKESKKHHLRFIRKTISEKTRIENEKNREEQQKMLANM